jgi:ABC-type uncharacterized transport system ATPase subunit
VNPTARPGPAPEALDLDARTPSIAMRNISKRFGTVQALDSVSLSLHRGEVHALLGENGAGKTTLMNILCGLYAVDAGEVLFDGRPETIRSPQDASRLRIGMVHQHFELVQAFTALENVVLARESGVFRMDLRTHREAIMQVAERYGLKVDLDRRVSDMEVGDHQKVEILKALYGGATTLILDEPTTHLTPAETDRLFESVRELAADGVTVVLIAHKIREILAVADRLTVLRKGRLVKSLSATGVAPDEVVRLVIGDKSLTPPSRRELETGATVLEMQGVVTAAEHGGVALSGVDLQIRGGEILGVAGVAGNGQRELVETLAGLRRVKKGRVEFHGRDITRSSTARRIRSRIAVLPADRIRDGILAAAPLYETFALGSHLSSSGRWSLRGLRRNALHMIEEYGVAASGPSAATGGLSGGNIQKVLVARAMRILGGDAGGLLVAANPTNGLDVGASSFVHHQLLAAKGAGSAVLLLSEDLDELFELSDRVVVLEGGRLHGDFARESFDRREVGALMVASND